MQSIGTQIPPDDAFLLFIHVLWMESCGNILAAEAILKKAQDDYIALVGVFN